MSREPAEAPSNFPHWVTLGSLAFVLWLFFTNTVPATQERDALQNLDAELTELRIRYDQAIEDARLRIAAEPDYDLQALLLAIDAQGFTPAELCLAFPENRVLGPGTGAPSGTPR